MMAFLNEKLSLDAKNPDEFDTIRGLAKNLIGKTFYAMHRFDFRGRLLNDVKFLNFPTE